VALPEEAHGGPAVATGETAAARIDPAFLAEVRKTLEDAARTALATAPQTLEERLFALSVSGRADALPRLSAMLRGLSRPARRPFRGLLGVHSHCGLPIRAATNS